METKKQLRTKLKNIRAQLSKEEQNDLSYIITGKVVTHYDFQKAKDILIYMHYNGEVQTDGIILYAFMMGKRVWIPRVEGDTMHFYGIRDLKECIAGFRGILEPAPDAPLFVADSDSPKEDTLMILPGLGFDKEGGRIGYGGGFYDKYLEANPNCMKMAVAYDIQQTEKIPMEKKDIPMDVIITDKQVILREE